MATGVVEEWDDPRGVGTVRLDDGRVLALQCTEIADGSRTTAVGTRVTVEVAPGHHGLWHATAVRPA
jgi:cold shock CspA family protein